MLRPAAEIYKSCGKSAGLRLESDARMKVGPSAQQITTCMIDAEPMMSTARSSARAPDAACIPYTALLGATAVVCVAQQT